jgi:hypothetical protein
MARQHILDPASGSSFPILHILQRKRTNYRRGRDMLNTETLVLVPLYLSVSFQVGVIARQLISRAKQLPWPSCKRVGVDDGAYVSLACPGPSLTAVEGVSPP